MRMEMWSCPQETYHMTPMDHVKKKLVGIHLLGVSKTTGGDSRRKICWQKNSILWHQAQRAQWSPVHFSSRGSLSPSLLFILKTSLTSSFPVHQPPLHPHSQPHTEAAGVLDLTTKLGYKGIRNQESWLLRVRGVSLRTH